MSGDDFIGVSHLRSARSPLWRQLLGEFIGVLFIVFIGCGSAISGGTHDDHVASVVRIALAFGLTVAAVVEVVGHVSGGHVNPAVTLGLLSVRKITLLPALLYICAQMLGGLAGAGLLKALSPDDPSNLLGINKINKNLNAAQGFGIEFLITALLIFTVLAVTDKGRGPEIRGSASLTIGIAVVIGHLLAIKFTGCGMNPARVFGPAVVTGIWDDHWAYWVGECGGAVFAALLYVTFFSAQRPLVERLCGSPSVHDFNNHRLSKGELPVAMVTVERSRNSSPMDS